MPLKHRWRLLVFAAGGVVFAFLLWRVGLGRLVQDFRKAGWTLLPILLLWIPVHGCYAGAWHVTMADAPTRPPFWRTFLISVSSFAVNLVTPLAQVGGEVYRTTSVAPWLGGPRATSSIVTYYMIHALSNMLTWLLGIVGMIILVRLPAPVLVPLLMTGAVIAALIIFIFMRHQQGVVAPLLKLVRGIPLLGRLAAPLEKQRLRIEELDGLITGFYQRDPRRFFLAAGLDTVGRILSTGEFWIMGRAIGLDIGPLQAFVIGAFGLLAVNIVFFVPLEAGVKEGSFFLIFQMLGLDPSLGVFAAIVQRLREFVWIGIGLLFIGATGTGVLRERRTTSRPVIPGEADHGD
ncbi:MAG TPA: lysylphosphatidylglycerol synthase transmembrane domain-containing protein [Gemmatimonadales bacterium]|jgi:hypothetical protein